MEEDAGCAKSVGGKRTVASGFGSETVSEAMMNDASRATGSHEMYSEVYRGIAIGVSRHFVSRVLRRALRNSVAMAKKKRICFQRVGFVRRRWRAFSVAVSAPLLE